MQLKIKRSQREGGVLAKTAIFIIDARVQFTAQERANITRYKLGNQVIYNSEASKRALDKGDAHLSRGSIGGNLKSLAYSALAAMNLNITIASLEGGQHVECKSLDELLGAEDAIMEACRNLKGYLDTASTFDGREVLVDFADGEPAVVATAVTPQPMLVQEPTRTMIAAPAALEAAPAPPLVSRNVAEPTPLDDMRAGFDTFMAKPFNLVMAGGGIIVIGSLIFIVLSLH